MRFRIPNRRNSQVISRSSDSGIIAKMDQETPQSTASFGSSNHMTNHDVTEMAMAGQIVAGEVSSSIEQSPAQSSDSVLETMVQRRGASRGRGQERSANQRPRIPDERLPRIPDHDDGSADGLGRGRSVLPRTLDATLKGIRSRSPTPRPSPSGQSIPGKSPATGTPDYHSLASKMSGKSSPKSGAGQNSPAQQVHGAADEKLDQMLAKMATRSCNSPSGMSQTSALPDGERLAEADMRVERSPLPTPMRLDKTFPVPFPPHPFQQKALADTDVTNANAVRTEWQNLAQNPVAVQKAHEGSPLRQFVSGTVSPISDVAMFSQQQERKLSNRSDRRLPLNR